MIILASLFNTCYFSPYFHKKVNPNIEGQTLPWLIFLANNKLQTTVNLPEINITNNGITYSMGSSYIVQPVAEGESGLPITFSIENKGSQNLTLTGNPNVAISGANSTEFIVTQPANSIIPSGNNSTFTIVFSPKTTGSKNAVLTISNNDADESSYTLNLSSIGRTSTSLFGGEVTLESRTGYFTYTQTLSDTRDVYLIYTNTATTSPSTKPTVSNVYNLSQSLVLQQKETFIESGMDGTLTIVEKPEVQAMNAVLPPYNPITESDKSIEPLLYETVGQTLTFNTADDPTSVSATVKKVITFHGWTLVVWVADNVWWGSCVKTYCIDQAKVDALASKFLNSGTNDDIFEWTTAVAGYPWGNHSNANLIDQTITTIHIFLYDIDNDNVPSGSVTTGYFWPYNNTKKTVTGYGNSNERLMFYVDSVIFAQPEGSTWEVSDSYPSIILGTLAHEFQHMIHYYQKNILKGTASEIWVNELSSMAIEDLLASKMSVAGPRSNTSAGSGTYPITGGRFPEFLDNNYYSVAAWSGQLYNYSLNYAFGSYLIRACGGAKFIHDLVVNNANVGTGSITTALQLSDNCKSWDFNKALRYWGASTLLSDFSGNSFPYSYNIGDNWSSSAYGGVTYNLGSINIYNYGNPYIWTSSSDPTYYGTSNSIIKVATGKTGTVNYNVTLPANVMLTVVTKKIK
jgi:hypothetical protein